MSSTATADGGHARAARWLNSLLVIAIGVALAFLTLKLFSTPNPNILPEIEAVQGQNANQQSPDTMARAIAARHLFGDAAAKPAPEAEKKPVKRIEETRLNLQLAGVFAYQPQERAIAIIGAGNGEQGAYGIGDKISGDTTLEEVHADHVVLNNRGKLEKLMLPDDVQPIAMQPVQPVAQPAAPQGAPQNGGGEAMADPNNAPIELPTNPGELRDTLAKNPSMLGRVVAAEPYQENGKLVGYRIMPKQNPEILEAQGIIAGDVITRVNNIDLNSQKQGIRALRNAVKADNLEVTILRDGVEIPVSISLAQ
ncbi:MAG: type II secretion system protein GspC [Gammaproteobacteria bacterium]|nr:MAG: type II secretion system protein GspC [Gammaproteobacteria bacterium]PIE37691.1 MAG: type II secretion system protein GspC [Gammaproteobacteria bacterium]